MQFAKKIIYMSIIKVILNKEPSARKHQTAPLIILLTKCAAGFIRMNSARDLKSSASMLRN